MDVIVSDRQSFKRLTRLTNINISLIRKMTSKKLEFVKIMKENRF